MKKTIAVLFALLLSMSFWSLADDPEMDDSSTSETTQSESDDQQESDAPVVATDSECRNNGKTVDCFKCDKETGDTVYDSSVEEGKPCPVGTFTDSSLIDNVNYEYNGFGYDYRVNNTPSGCGGCGVSGPEVGNTLPSLQITRRLRPRFQNHFLGYSSFGKGQYWQELDRMLLLQVDKNIRVIDPTQMDKKIFSVYNPSRSGWADFEDEAFRVITLFDANDGLITSNADMANARSAVLLRHNGVTEHYQLFWRRDSDRALITGGGTKRGRGFGRLVALTDRNGNSVTIEYEKAIDANGFLNRNAKANRLNTFDDLWRKSKVTDAYGRTITITNGNGRFNRNYITKLLLPNGNEIKYTYRKLFGVKTVKRIDFPDGSVSTWSGRRDVDGFDTVVQSDKAASGSNQEKRIYLTRSFTTNSIGES